MSGHRPRFSAFVRVVEHARLALLHGAVAVASVAVASVALMATGCIINDPNHCAHRAGDETCAEVLSGGFCSSCTRENNGCVATAPEAMCHAPWGSGIASSEGSSGSAGDPSSDEGEVTGSDSSSTGTPVQCNANASTDPACSEESPYCVDNTCVGCEDAGGATFCGALDPATPACFASTCRECVPGEANTCSGTDSFCNEQLTCGGCTEHAQCPDSACNVATGTCLPTAIDAVFYVDNKVCPGIGYGSLEQPYCSLATALSNVDAGEEATIRLVATGDPYAEAVDLTTIPAATIAIVGLGGGGRPVISGTASSGGAAEIDAYDNLFLADVNLSGGLRCEGGGSLWLDRVRVQGSEADGVSATGCDVDIRRSEVLASAQHGIRFENHDEPLILRNTIVASNGSTGAETAGLFLDNAGADITYSTIAFNRGDSMSAWERSISCVVPNVPSEQPLIRVRNSIVVAAGGGSIGCPWATYDYSLVDTEGLDGVEQVVVGTPLAEWFVDTSQLDYRIRAGTPAQDVARWDIGDPWVDFEGSPRPTTPGAPDYAGADRP